MTEHDIDRLMSDPDALRKLIDEYVILKETVENSPLHFAVYDRCNRLVAWNKTYESNYPEAFRRHRREGGAADLYYDDLLRSMLSRTLPAAEVEAEVARRLTYQRDCKGEESIRQYGDHWLRVHKYRLPSGAVAGLAVDVTALLAREHELEVARAAAEAGVRAKAEFLATMSHEIRTPMNGVIGLARLLGESTLTAEQGKCVSMIARSAEALLEIINDILDFSKLEADKMTVAIAPMDVAAIVDDVVGLLSIAAGAKDVNLRVDWNSRLAPWRMGDAKRLRQCLLNIVGNAVKFTDEGEVVVMAAEDPDGALTLAVRDSGIGIPTDRLEAVFNAFEQVDSASTRRFQGTGLGLAITRRLVALMRGELTVSSQEGVGSTFTMRLPLTACAPPAAEDAPAPGSAPAGDFRELRVLLADDNAINCVVFEKLLEPTGAKVEACADGLAAVASFQGRKPDIVFMDVSMPVMSGLEAAAAIRTIERREGCSPTPIIALTANAMDATRRRCLEAGMTDFLTKPIDRAALFAAIHQWRPARRVEPQSG